MNELEAYIGTKIVQAEPATRGEALAIMNKLDEVEIARIIGQMPADGYRVIYSDGYESWSPKEIFEQAYLKLMVNSELQTDKPSVSQEMVDAFISSYEVCTMGNKCTVVRAILRNGFEIVESSACVSEENYDEEMGAQICLSKIKDKVWFLLGFLLQTAIHGVKEE